MKVGLIRPFLLLVSMHPLLRWQIAMLLGWCIISSPSFGNSHKEAWEILDTDLKGIVARANSTRQSIQPFANSCTYYDILRKLQEAVFHRSPAKELPYNESLAASSQSSDKRMIELEDRFIDDVIESRRKNMSEEERKKFAERPKSLMPELDLTNAEVLERITLKNEATKEYCKALVEEVMKSPIEYTKSVAVNFLVSKHIMRAKSTISGVAGGMARVKLSSPLHMAKLAYEGAQVIFGESVEKLYGPIVCLMYQRILLAAFKCDVDQFYSSETIKT